jgi:hypothetical protein
MTELLADYAATGVPPAYLSTVSTLDEVSS